MSLKSKFKRDLAIKFVINKLSFTKTPLYGVRRLIGASAQVIGLCGLNNSWGCLGEFNSVEEDSAFCLFVCFSCLWICLFGFDFVFLFLFFLFIFISIFILCFIISFDHPMLTVLLFMKYILFITLVFPFVTELKKRKEGK